MANAESTFQRGGAVGSSAVPGATATAPSGQSVHGASAASFVTGRPLQRIDRRRSRRSIPLWAETARRMPFRVPIRRAGWSGTAIR
jgi:hypothetical protein